MENFQRIPFENIHSFSANVSIQNLATLPFIDVKIENSDFFVLFTSILLNKNKKSLEGKPSF
jgi:hypothetical protein